MDFLRNAGDTTPAAPDVSDTFLPDPQDLIDKYGGE